MPSVGVSTYMQHRSTNGSVGLTESVSEITSMCQAYLKKSKKIDRKMQMSIK